MKFPINAKTPDTQLIPEAVQQMTTVLPKQESTSEFNPTRYMVGTFKDPKDGQWKLGYAQLDVTTLQLGPVQVDKEANGGLDIAVERFKIKVDHLGIFSSEDRKQENQ